VGMDERRLAEALDLDRAEEMTHGRTRGAVGALDAVGEGRAGERAAEKLDHEVEPVALMAAMLGAGPAERQEGNVVLEDSLLVERRLAARLRHPALRNLAALAERRLDLADGDGGRR